MTSFSARVKNYSNYSKQQQRLQRLQQLQRLQFLRNRNKFWKPQRIFRRSGSEAARSRSWCASTTGHAENVEVIQLGVSPWSRLWPSQCHGSLGNREEIAVIPAGTFPWIFLMSLIFWICRALDDFVFLVIEGSRGAGVAGSLTPR